MKKSIVLALMAAACFCAAARQVDLATARRAASYYFYAATGAKSPAAESLVLVQQIDNQATDQPALYAFNVPGGGYVVVSASDCVEPILAYSPNGSIASDQVSPACRYLLRCYADLVALNENSGAVAGYAVAEKWASLIDETFEGSPAKSSVLIQTKWGQGDPNEPTYNILCPKVDGRPSITGCVAVAMAQIVRYWEYPVKGGSGSTTSASVMWNGTRIIYDFTKDSNKFVYDSMPNSVKKTSEWNVKRAVGKLMFAVGVAAKMNWSLTESSASSNNVATAFPRYFNYSTSCRQAVRADMDDARWTAILRSEVRDCARPVYYSAHTPEDESGESVGHAFVVCGLSGSDSNKFYINFGWDGRESGFYTLAPLSQMSPAGGYVFSESNNIIYHLCPATEGIANNTAFASAPAYPNPATDYLMVPAALPLNALLSVYSIDGKMVDKQIIPGGTDEYRLDLSRYPAGAYFYRLNNSAVKFIVER